MVSQIQQPKFTKDEIQLIVKSDTFQALLQKKKNFILPTSIFFFIFYFTLPIMTSYTTILNQPIMGALTWAWIFAFAQFFMTWGLCILYTNRAKRFDHMVSEIMEIKRTEIKHERR